MSRLKQQDPQYMHIILDGEKVQIRAEIKQVGDGFGGIAGSYLSPILPRGLTETTGLGSPMRSFVSTYACLD